MELISNRKASLGLNSSLKAAISFVILFALYHAAEYMIMFKNDILFFFVFQFLFFFSAALLGKWYSGNGLSAWGLDFSRKVAKVLLPGIILGILLYAIPYFISLALGIEAIANVPPVDAIILSSLPFAFGVLFTSFSEDILTRGIVYAHFNRKLKPVFLILLSATIYLLNHIYRLAEGPEALIYIFLLGIVFMIPVLHTRALWLTGTMHWAGNLFFYVSHNVITTTDGDSALSSNYLFAICLLIFIPVIWILTKKFSFTSIRRRKA